jgi:crossover junction endodeoxyribonuclease RusA
MMLLPELLYPPSVNNYYRHVGNRTLISRRGRAYRKSVCSTIVAAGVRPMAGPLAVTIELHPPDRRRRDCDNAQKALCDALQHGGAYLDDSQIKDLHTVMREPCRGGKAVVRIEAMAT